MNQANFDTRKEQESDARDSSNWSASQYNKTASFVYSAAFTAPVLELLDAQPGERILDVGCGSGEVTLQLQKIVEQKEVGMVVGTDFSESMVTNYQSERNNTTTKLKIVAREGQIKWSEVYLSCRRTEFGDSKRYTGNSRQI